MKRFLPILLLTGFSSPVMADITHSISSSVQLNVEAAATQVSRIGSSYSVSGTNIDVTTFGDIDTLAKPQKSIIKKVKEKTQHNTGMQLIAAFNYSGRDEIIRALKKILKDVKLEKISSDMIDNNLMSAYLDTANIPDPDLIIRTSGEMRLSNFLLWQCAYSEFVFTDTLWPDFNVDHFLNALRQYSQRERRFGRNTPQKGA